MLYSYSAFYTSNYESYNKWLVSYEKSRYKVTTETFYEYIKKIPYDKISIYTRDKSLNNSSIKTTIYRYKEKS